MCINIDPKETEKFKSKKGEVKVWKVLSYLGNKEYCTPYKRVLVESGMVLSNAVPFTSVNYVVRGEGVHAFVDRKHAMWSDAAYSTSWPVLVECTANMDDFIAVGIHGDIAFTKLTIGELP
mgnify:CR=1 FL=1